MNLTDFLLARLAEDEAAARLCAEMFPSPWDVADRGWRVRIYAGDVPIEDLMSDEPGATATRNPVVMEVEPDRRIEDPRWLTERVEHVRRHDPARVLAEVEAKRRIVTGDGGRIQVSGYLLAVLAQPHRDHPDFREEWRP
jgi:hypothetical protein